MSSGFETFLFDPFPPTQKPPSIGSKEADASNPKLDNIMFRVLLAVLSLANKARRENGLQSTDRNHPVGAGNMEGWKNLTAWIRLKCGFRFVRETKRTKRLVEITIDAGRRDDPKPSDSVQPRDDSKS